jgi:hypothetical protein
LSHKGSLKAPITITFESSLNAMNIKAVLRHSIIMMFKPVRMPHAISCETLVTVQTGLLLFERDNLGLCYILTDLKIEPQFSQCLYKPRKSRLSHILRGNVSLILQKFIIVLEPKLFQTFSLFHHSHSNHRKTYIH